MTYLVYFCNFQTFFLKERIKINEDVMDLKKKNAKFGLTVKKIN